MKVRLSDGSDGSIGQVCFPSDKKLSVGEKMTSSQARSRYQLNSDCPLDPMDPSDKRVYYRTNNFPMDI